MLEIKEGLGALEDVEAAIDALETNVKLLEDIVLNMENKVYKH